MDVKILKPIAIVLMLVGSFCSCTENGEVPYKPCPCDEEKPMLEIQQFPQGEAYLFKDYIPEPMAIQINNKIYSDPYPKVCWIVYDSKTDVAIIRIANICLNSKDDCLLRIGQICNFPDYVKEWAIPENGCKVDIEGISYESCFPTYAFYYPMDYVLIKFKRK